MFTDKNELAPPAAYISCDLAAKYRAAILKVESLYIIHGQWIDSVTIETIEKAEKAAWQILVEICENHTREAVRSGSIYDKYDLPAIIGKDSPSNPESAPATVAKMAVDRGHTLDE